MVMGLLTGGINEVIATTAVNAAPMGIHKRNGKLTMALFQGSHTARNVERDGWVVANLVHDPVLYVRTAFEDLPNEAFREEPVNGRKMCRLADAEGWVACTAMVEHRTAESIVVSLTVEKEILLDVALHPVNRGFNSIVDATVHATRYRINRDPHLKKLIDYHTVIIRKCGGKRELEALDLLMNFLL
jgi:uncharacterized protein